MDVSPAAKRKVPVHPGIGEIRIVLAHVDGDARGPGCGADHAVGPDRVLRKDADSLRSSFENGIVRKQAVEMIENRRAPVEPFKNPGKRFLVDVPSHAARFE